MNESDSEKAHAIPQLLRDLRQHDWSVNGKAADALAEIGRYAIPQLLQALEDADGYVRNGAAIALGKIGDTDAIQPLIKALQRRDDRVYEDDEDQEARISAATALGRLRTDPACQALMVELEKLRSTDSTLRSYIVEALGEIGDPKAVPHIVRTMGSGDFEYQKIASWALARLGADGIDALLRMAANRDQPGRPYIIRALGANSVKSAIPLLLQILEEPSGDKFVRCQAAEAIGRIGGSPKVLTTLIAMLKAPEEEVVHVGVLFGLGALHDSVAYCAIVEQLDNERLRYTAVRALGELGDPRACELLIPLLSHGDHSLTFHAATALEKIGCHDALPSLIQVRDRMATSDSTVSRTHALTVEGVIQKLQQRKHESGRN